MIILHIYGHMSQNYALFNLLNENVEQCTKVKRSNVHTSASTFFKSICEIINIINIIIFTMFI